MKSALFTILLFPIIEAISFLLTENSKKYKPNQKRKSVITIALAVFFAYSI